MNWVAFSLLAAAAAAGQAVPETQSLGNTLFVSPAICDGVKDARGTLQNIVTHNAGKTIVLPDGAICLMTPVADKTKFLSLPTGTVLRGKATLKVANSSAPYNSVFSSTSCGGCQISEVTIDANIANNPIVDTREIYAHPRIEFVLSGDDMSFRGITIMNSSSINSIIATGSRIAVEDSTFKAIGDDPNHIAHDHSTLYLTGSQMVVRGNQFTAIRRDSPAAVTAIETHGTGQSIVGNTIADFTNGMNITGVSGTDSEADVVSGNTIRGVLYCITLWSRAYRAHTAGYGINGLVVSNNSCRVNQLSYSSGAGVSSTTGITVDSNSTLPIANFNISNNVVVFDLESPSRPGNTVSTGIGWWSVNNQRAANVSIQNNIVDNAPVAGIRMAVGSAVGLEIRGNTVRNAGSSLDPAVNAGYKVPVMAVSASGALQADIEANTILDDLGTSRMVYPMTLGGAAGVTHHVRISDNSIYLLGATTTSFKSYVSILDNHIKPLLRLIAAGKVWSSSSYPQPMAAGSEVFDATNGAQFNLWADGTAWIRTRAASGDSAGTLVITAASSASKTFAAKWTRAPVCTLTPTTAISQPYWVTSSATEITAFLNSPATITFNYICIENPN